MVVDYLLQESGDKIFLEDGSGFLLLESTVQVIVIIPDIGVQINATGDISTFVRTANDGKIYLNSL